MAPISIVTGGSRGIGLHVARALGRAGHRVVLTAREPDRLNAACEELRQADVECTAVAADLLEPDAAPRVVAAARAAFGEPTVLVNNAGTAPTAKAEATDDAMMTATFGLHVLAPMRLVREVLPAMKQGGEGAIVQLASTAGLRGYPFTTAYTAAKHGMVGLTRALHAELGQGGVGVYAICPGFVDTDITRAAAAAVAGRGRSTEGEAFAAMAAQNRIGRMHTPAEVAEAVLRVLRERPPHCIYELDRDPPAFLD